MFAVIESGGKQHTVSEGESLKVELLSVEEGATIEFDKVLMISDGSDSKIGNPYVEKDLKKGIKNFLLFIVPISKQKLPEDFSYHFDVIENIKKQFGKDIVLLIDTCLCSITPDGHCGVTNHKTINLKDTHYSLGVAANTYLEAGADIIAPSDMMKNTTKYLKKTVILQI